MSTTVGVKVDEDTHKRLKKLADQKDRSPHWIMKKALNEYLDREEQVEQERIEDEARWERYVLTNEAVDHSDVDKWLANLEAGSDTPCPT